MSLSYIIPEFLRYFPSSAVSYITILYNTLLITESYPSSWRRVGLAPLPKPSKDATLPSSYRFIGLLSYMEKLFELLLEELLHKFLPEMHSSQFGLRRQHSTTQLLSSTTTSVTAQMARERERDFPVTTGVRLCVGRLC